MVTSSELCSIVTTEDNSFLIWGSRPVIKSPLVEILEQNLASSKTPHKSTTGDPAENVFPDSSHSGPGTPNIKRVPSQPAKFDPPPPEISDPSQNRTRSLSGEGSLETRKKSTNDMVTKGSPQRTVSRDSVTSSMPQMVGSSSRNPSFDFSDVPRSLVVCPECDQYHRTLSEVLMELLDVSWTGVRGGGGAVGKTQSLKRETSTG